MDRDVRTMGMNALHKGQAQLYTAITLMDDGQERSDLFERQAFIIHQLSQYFGVPNTVSHKTTVEQGLALMAELDKKKPRQWKENSGGCNG